MKSGKIIWIATALVLLATLIYGVIQGRSHVAVSTGLGVLACSAAYLLIRKLEGSWLDDAMLSSLMILAIVLGTGLDFYNTFWWWDVMLHTVAGIMLVLLARLLTHTKQKLWIRLVMMLLVANGLGAIWEVYEYATYVTPHESLITDTITDLIANLCGSVLGLIFALKNKDMH